ncbi:MAG: hypothetical protein Q9169_003640 [Polycauliona sp. 2 TL-2023]
MQWLLLMIPAVAGFLAHYGFFFHGEWHLKGSNVLLAHAALAIITWWYLLRPASATASESVYLCTICFGSYLFALFSSILTYRLFFHPLRHLPGPRLAACSKLWHVFKCRDGINFNVLEEMRLRYGGFVRTGPNEVTIFHPAAVEILDAPKNKTTRTDWYDVLHPRTSTIFTRNEEEHSVRRRVWSHAMSAKAIAQYYSRIQQQVQRLADLIANHQGAPVLLNDVMSWFAFDSMGEFMFKSDFGMMTSSTWHPAISNQRDALAMLAPLSDAIWLVRLAFDFLPFFGKVKKWNQMVEFCDAAMQKRMQAKVEETDIASWFIDEFDQSKSTKSLEDRQNLLSGNTVTAIVAGSDTTRPSLICIWYALAKHPYHADKIYEELVDCNIDDANALASVPHLEAVINETLRLWPPAMTGQNRMTSDHGLWIDDTWIPGNTKVAAPKYSIMRCESVLMQHQPRCSTIDA